MPDLLGREQWSSSPKIGHKPELFNSIYRGISEGFVP